MKYFLTYKVLFFCLWIQRLYCSSCSNEEEFSSEFSRNREYHNQKRDYHNLKGDYYDLKGEYQDLKIELCNLKKEIQEIKNNLNRYQDLKIELCTLKKEVACLKKEIKDGLYQKDSNVAQNSFQEERESTKVVQSSKTSFMKNFDNRFCYFELLPGYFYPTDKRLRDIYDNGGFNGQAEMGVFALDWLGIWLKGGAFWQHGKTKVLRSSTRIIIGNISAGIKFFIPIVNQMQLYLGIGPRVFFLRVKNDSSFVEQRVNKTRVGGAAVGGFLLFPVKDVPFFFDLFVDYSFSHMKFSPNQSSERNNLDLDGPTIGAGVGYQF